MRIGLAFNLKPERDKQHTHAFSDAYLEWDDEETVTSVERALTTCGEVLKLEADRDFPLRLRDARPDIVFNVAEGFHGANREAHVPAICEFFNVPFSGSDSTTLGICLDKSRTKELLGFHGIVSAPFAVVNRVEECGLVPPLPVIVKPLHEGSSRGITQQSVCTSVRELESAVRSVLEQCRQPALVEQWLPGREFTVAIIGNGAGARTLPIVEVAFDGLPPDAKPLYSYEGKWKEEVAHTPILVCPADLSASLESQVSATALAAYHALRCRDWARVDMRCDEHGIPYVLEVNPLPGIHPDPNHHSAFPLAARSAGLLHSDVVRRVLTLATQRYALID